MADTTVFQSATAATPPAGTVVSDEEVTTLNGSTVTAQKLQRLILALRTGDATAEDIDSDSRLPVADAVVAAALASILTSVDGLEGYTDAIEAKLDTLHADVDGLEGKDFATQTTAAAILAKLIAAPSTEAKQDTANTSLASILTSVDGLEALTALLATAAQIGEVQASPTANTVLARLKTLEGYLDGVEGLLTTIRDNADTLESNTTGLATQATLASILSDLQAKADLAETQPVSAAQAAGPSSATQAGTSVTVGTSSSTLVSANGARKLLVITNDHATQIVYLRLGASAAVANQGIRLNAAGGSVTIRGDEYTGEVRAIASGASTVVTLSEV